MVEFKKDVGMILLFCVLIVATRLLFITAIPHQDEALWYDDAIKGDYINYMVPHPPLSVWVYNLAYNLTYLLRFVPLFFNLLVFVFGSLILKEISGDRNALRWYCIMFLFSFWNYLAGLQLDIDGAILPAMITISFYFFLRYERTKKRSSYVLSSIFFGLAMLTKATGAFIIIILGVYFLLNTRSIIKPIKKLLPMLLIGAAIFSIFPILCHGAPRFEHILLHAGTLGYIPTPVHLLYFFIWGTPLLVFLFLLGHNLFDEKTRLLVLWVLIPLLIYSLGLPFASPFDRYLMITIPPLLMLGAVVISSHIKDKSYTPLIALLSFGILLIIPAANKYIPHSFPDYFKNLISLNWDFMLPITGPSGPAFGLPMQILIGVSVISFILCCFIIFNKFARPLFVLFLAIGLAYNCYLITLMVFSPNQASIQNIKVDMLRDMNDYKDMYTNEKSFVTFFPGTKIVKDEKILNGDVFIFNYPLQQASFFDRFKDCTVIKEYISYNQTFGYHYGCSQ